MEITTFFENIINALGDNQKIKKIKRIEYTGIISYSNKRYELNCQFDFILRNFKTNLINEKEDKTYKNIAKNNHFIGCVTNFDYLKNPESYKFKLKAKDNFYELEIKTQGMSGILKIDKEYFLILSFEVEIENKVYRYDFEEYKYSNELAIPYKITIDINEL